MNDYKCDSFGNIDSDFYVEQAYELRRVYIASLMKKVKASVKAYLANLSISRGIHNSTTA